MTTQSETNLDHIDDIVRAGHPINTLLKEHELMVAYAKELKEVGIKIHGGDESPELKSRAVELSAIFKDAEKHYLREENVLFPYLEKHGITQPPKVMWMEHDMIRDLKKNLYALIKEIDTIPTEECGRVLEKLGREMSETLESHFYKENNMLFKMALEVMTEEEFVATSKEFADIGYCDFTPLDMVDDVSGKMVEATPEFEGGLDFPSGHLNREQFIAIMNTLPVDVTFVDHENKVRYFNQTKDPIFHRTVAALGTKVQNCHPQKSLHMVNKIIDDFRTGAEDSAEFWIPFEGKFAYIRYFAIRNQDGEYLGTMEVTQDVTPLQKLEGQKRLLDQ